MRRADEPDGSARRNGRRNGRPGPAGVADQAGQGWRASWPELVLAGLLVAAVSLAGYAFAGPGAPAVVLISPAAWCSILLRGMAAPAAAAAARAGYRD